jgi:hypothetical protein
MRLIRVCSAWASSLWEGFSARASAGRLPLEHERLVARGSISTRSSPGATVARDAEAHHAPAHMVLILTSTGCAPVADTLDHRGVLSVWTTVDGRAGAETSRPGQGGDERGWR